MARGNLAPEDADLASMSDAGGCDMAGLLERGDESVEADEDWLATPFDVIAYAGPITTEGYEQIYAGGDPHAAFRIARALGANYESVRALVPRYCKSAGTLIVLGASALYMDDQGELGPLDVQIRRDDELTASNSGLEYFTALDFLSGSRQKRIFRDGDGARERIDETHRRADRSVSTGGGHRALSIAQAYGVRLASRGRNLREAGLDDLITAYPSHSFVIDRKEARRLFLRVYSAQGVVRRLSEWVRNWMRKSAQGDKPALLFQTFPFNTEECVDAQQGNGDHPAHGEESAPSAGDRESAESCAVHPGSGAVPPEHRIHRAASGSSSACAIDAACSTSAP
ncbi:serine dehydrogenase proteinase domain-containing protein [Ditylenchus destructor]|nr:serine dehydrogenase proteinase domain-containing protein [Ditylenchus destructor]